MHRVPLRFAEGLRWAFLQEPTGRDEIAIGEPTTRTAIDLIDRLAVASGADALEPGHAEQLAASDRDQILAAIHQASFGDEIASTLRCAHCGSLFDLTFSLGRLAYTVLAEGQAPGQATIAYGDGRVARLPSGSDECAVAGLPPAEAEAELARRCLGFDAGPDDIATFTSALATAAPVIGIDLAAECPECRTATTVAFDMQTFLLTRFAKARPVLVREVHRIALAYGWALDEILGLTRTLRRSFVAAIDGETVRRARPARLAS